MKMGADRSSCGYACLSPICIDVSIPWLACLVYKNSLGWVSKLYHFLFKKLKD